MGVTDLAVGDRVFGLVSGGFGPEVITDRRGVPPLVLLDDVLSELDASRRRTLAERIGRSGQAVVTATGADALPLEPAQLLEVTPGVVTVR